VRYRAILFDLDGTLLDTVSDLADSMNSVLSAAGLPVHDTQAYKYFVGKGMKNLTYKALPDSYRVNDTVDRYVKAMLEEYEKRWDKKTKPYKGICEMLDTLVNHDMRLAILSNKTDQFTKKTVERFLSDWEFEYVFGEREGIPKKPDPTSALEIAGLMSLDSKDFIYLGDSGTDMQTARAAGMYAVGAGWGFRKIEELISAGAQKIINKPEELSDVLT